MVRHWLLTASETGDVNAKVWFTGLRGWKQEREERGTGQKKSVWGSLIARV